MYVLVHLTSYIAGAICYSPNEFANTETLHFLVLLDEGSDKLPGCYCNKKNNAKFSKCFFSVSMLMLQWHGDKHWPGEHILSSNALLYKTALILLGLFLLFLNISSDNF